ncbi:MAG: hypothetical protein WBF13_04750 [Candidatus Zixiibacteriota bacterium]
MITSAWNNGEHHESGAGYGLSISSEDRDVHFERHWKTVFVEIPFHDAPIEAEVNIAKKSFWDPQCGELIKLEIGRWLISEGYRLWPRGIPPKIELTPIDIRRFKIMGVIRA